MFLITVHLFANNGNIKRLHEFERLAVTAVRQYHGELIAAFQPANPDHSADVPDEIHLLKFPSRSHFEKYLHSPEVAALAEQRNLTIRKSLVFVSEKIVDYSF